MTQIVKMKAHKALFETFDFLHFGNRDKDDLKREADTAP